MRKGRFGLSIMVLLCSVIYMGYTVEQVDATQSEVKGDASVSIATKDSTPLTKRNQNKSGLHAIKPMVLTVSAHEAKSPQKVIRQATSDSKKAGRKSRRKGRMRKKGARKVLIEPRAKLIPHGLIEGPQRYDPRPNFRTAGVRDPQTRDLIHDHFQELDRNKDGRVDPFERAFGRLDMDRDLPSRQLQ